MKKNIIYLLSFSILFSISSCRDSINEPGEEKITEEQEVVSKLKPIEYPSEKVLWEQGESHEIKWSVTKNLDKVDIILLRKYKQVAVISEKGENDGNFIWTIPADLPGSHHYRIRLVSPYNLYAHSTSIEFEIQSGVGGPVETK